ncbi:MAG: glycosyltransferase [Betaproteobacteria bacterium]
MNKSDVIILVYRGVAQTRACIESVLAAKNDLKTEVVVMNDASPDGEIREYVTALAAAGRITLVTNETNLGFVATCNRAMQLHAERDLVLLNSDTVVADGWLDRLAACAVAAPLAASVTPFSNNATICSYPRIAVSNELPPGTSVAALDRIFSQVNARRFTEIPTAVGFCMYMKRAAIHAVGVFDEEAFGRGYGEENDWCMRATERGFSHLLCGDVFVYHQGEVSFGAESAKGKEKAQAVIISRYPEYMNLISKHLTEDPARGLRRNVDLARLSTSARPRVLFITHNWGGGTEKHVNDLASILAGNLEILVLKPYEEKSMSVHWLREGEEFAAFLSDRNDPQELLTLLRAIGVSRVHLHHVHGLPIYILDIHTALGVPLDVTLHDYFPMTQRYHLGPGGRVEDENDAQGNDWGLSPPQWRQRMADFLRSAARVIAPSHDLASRMLVAFPDVKMNVLGHHEVVRIPSKAMRKVLILGGLTTEKGLKVVEACARDALERNLPLFFKLIGHTAEKIATYPELPLSVGGTYHDSELEQLIALERADAFLFPSQIPESYSYTLTAAIHANLPIVASKLGAYIERLQGISGTQILPWNSAPQLWNDTLLVAMDTPRASSPPSQPQVTMDATGSGYANWYLQAIAPTQMQIASAAELPLDIWFEPKIHSPQKEFTLQQLFEIGIDCGHEPARTELRRRSAIADRQIASASARIDAAERERAEARNGIALAEARLAEDRKLVDIVNAELERMRVLIQEVQARLEEERDQARAAYGAVISSTSWQLTSPLRTLVGAARNWRAAFTELGISIRRLPRDAALAKQILADEGIGPLIGRVRSRFSARKAPVSGHIKVFAVNNTIEPLTIASSQSPQYSLVIPVYGQHLLTFNCIKSIAETCHDLSIEIIVIDDCSPEPASEALSVVTGIRIIRNKTNLGFLASCNFGATMAKGECLVILNNDLILTGDWLQRMAAVWQQFPDTGLVGAKLIYPDGRLQEAGGIVWRDGSAWNVGRDDDAGRPEYNYVREVDYCSGACLLIRRDFWNSLGGFDPAFVPAYYEDVDLAFRVREAGKRVFYQPHAVVVHFEGQSSGTDLTRGIKRHQVINQKTFVDRWGKILASHRVNGTLPEKERNRYTRTRVLVIDACMLTPDQDAGSLRMFEMLGLMRSMGKQVTFVATNLEHSLPYVANIQAIGVEVLHHPYVPSLVRYLELHGNDYDIIILSRETVASQYLEVVKRHATRAKVIFDTVDLHFLRAERHAALGNDTALRTAARVTRERELGLINKSDLTLVVSNTERELLKQLAPHAKVKIVSTIHEPMPGPMPFAEREGILFIGGFRHPPNLDAVTWYVEKVLPILRLKHPGLVTTVIGSNAPPSLQRFAGDDFVIAGFVPDITKLYHSARLSISPLRYGAGVKGKINLAMQYGVPVVATSISVEGMNLQDNENVLVADEPEDFADAVIRLHTDEALWNRLRQGGLVNIEEWFSRATARRALASVLED